MQIVCIFLPKSLGFRSHDVMYDKEPQMNNLLTEKLQTPAVCENTAMSRIHQPNVFGLSGGQLWEMQYPAMYEVNQGDFSVPLALSAIKQFGQCFAQGAYTCHTVLSGYLSVLLHQEMRDPKQGTPCACSKQGHDFQKNKRRLNYLSL